MSTLSADARLSVFFSILYFLFYLFIFSLLLNSKRDQLSEERIIFPKNKRKEKSALKIMLK